MPAASKGAPTPHRIHVLEAPYFNSTLTRTAKHASFSLKNARVSGLHLLFAKLLKITQQGLARAHKKKQEPRFANQRSFLLPLFFKQFTLPCLFL